MPSRYPYPFFLLAALSACGGQTDAALEKQTSDAGSPGSEPNQGSDAGGSTTEPIDGGSQVDAAREGAESSTLHADAAAEQARCMNTCGTGVVLYEKCNQNG